MNDFFPDNFVDYDGPAFSSNNLTPDQRDFSLTSPNSDSTGLFPCSYSPQAHSKCQNANQMNFDLSNYYNQQQVPSTQHEVPENSKKSTRRKAKPALNRENTDSSNDDSCEGKISDKSKRIQKREIAKERTKQKLDMTTLFQGVDQKFLPEGYDDPNLDERSKKKMIQMVRNRISAQNSRDRKKGYMTQLEEQNFQLEEEITRVTQERDRLSYELQNAHSEIEILKSRGSQSCCNCQGDDKEDDFIITDRENEQNLDDVPAGGFSGLTSPRLVRFASSRSGFLGLFALTCFIGMIAFGGIGQENFVLQGNGFNRLHEKRVLDTAENITIKGTTDLVTLKIPDYTKSLVLQNIRHIMAQFEQGYEPAYKAYLQKNKIFTGMTIQESMKMLKRIPAIDNKATKNAIVQYDASTRAQNLRKNVAPVISSNAPALNYGDPITSTLFCSSGHEFYDSGTQNIQSNNGEIVKNTSLGLEKAEYLQLLVPKGSIVRSNANGSIPRDIYGQNIYSDATSDDTMLEVWCKVFMVREIGSAY